MYLPKQFEQLSIEAMHALIGAHPLATLVHQGPDGLCANHLPMEVRAGPAANGTLLGHVARANPLWREAANGQEVLVIFHGADTYISPSWYASKQQTGKVVPTWNYAVVQARGCLRVRDDKHWVRQHIAALIAHNEAAFPQPWALDDAPAEFTDSLLAGVVGIEIEIRTLIGKWKVSQNRPAADRLTVAAGLRDLGTPAAREMADYVADFTGDQDVTG